MNKQEPTNKELLQIMFEITESAVSVLNEHRTVWRNFFNGKYTEAQSYTTMKKLRAEIDKLNKDTDTQFIKTKECFRKYAHLLEFKKEEQ